MRALILAGGKGTRLRPITDTVPKPMVPVNGKPLLEYHVELLRKSGIKEIWVALQYLPEVVMEYFGNGSKFGVEIHYSVELEGLGTSGAMRNQNSNIFNVFSNESFLITYGDNFTNFNYKDIIDFHHKNKAFMSIGLYQSDVPWMKGIVETDSGGKVLKMVEKPPKEECTTDQVNSGIYVCEKEIFDYIPEGISDFGFNVIPKILVDKKPIYALNKGFFVIDIGTFEGLEQANRKAKELKV